MPALNYTTTVPVTKTITEMQTILGKAGASAVAVLYTDGQPDGMTFTLRTPDGERAFHLPVDVPAVHTLLTSQARGNRRVDARPEQAARVAWRIVKDWLEAQVALIQAHLATLDEVMLPYLVVDLDNRTLREQWRDRAALPMGQS